jgi:hypothetical protein
MKPKNKFETVESQSQEVQKIIDLSNDNTYIKHLASINYIASNPTMVKKIVDKLYETDNEFQTKLLHFLLFKQTKNVFQMEAVIKLIQHEKRNDFETIESKLNILYHNYFEFDRSIPNKNEYTNKK